jgi:hypothetical protein
MMRSFSVFSLSNQQQQQQQLVLCLSLFCFIEGAARICTHALEGPAQLGAKTIIIRSIESE